MVSLLRCALCLGALSCGLPACAAQVSVHDPVMAREGNTTYLFSTGSGITFYSSTDMRSWKPEGRVFPGDPQGARQIAPTFDGKVWAPDLSFHNGKHYLYYSVSGFGKNTSAIGLMTNATLNPRAPDYKWQDQGIVLRSYPVRDAWNAIDPNLVEDAKGEAWLVFGSFWSGIKMFKLNAERTRPAEPQEWHALARRAAPAEDIEGPFIFKKNGYYYLFVSWGLCCKGKDSTYHVAVGRAREVTGPYLDKTGLDMAKGGGSLVIVPNRAWKGVGHNSVYTFDGKDVMVLHAYETADRYKPKLKVLQIYWDKEGWPVVDPAGLDRYQSVQLPHE